MISEENIMIELFEWNKEDAPSFIQISLYKSIDLTLRKTCLHSRMHILTIDYREFWHIRLYLVLFKNSSKKTNKILRIITQFEKRNFHVHSVLEFNKICIYFLLSTNIRARARAREKEQCVFNFILNKN